jgi:hypothetical protein
VSGVTKLLISAPGFLALPERRNVFRPEKWAFYFVRLLIKPTRNP